jgi:glycosyltransferase involved in cell wall biosynthesis
MAAQRDLEEDWEITALVHKASLIDLPGIRYIERPEIKKSWIRRLHFEYIESRGLAKDLKADYWFALHDISPRVGKVRQAVYCHNAMCFYRMSWKEIFFEPKLLAFSLFYGLLYRLNIEANEAVVVQQNWIRNEFAKRFDAKNIVVAHPIDQNEKKISTRSSLATNFLYPSFPRVFKNFETLLDAWEILSKDDNWHGNLTITLSGNENRYARYLGKRYSHLRNLTFAGILDKYEMQEIYKISDCLIFPSKLETWGLPLSEAISYDLAILAADLPYAHEAIGSYKKASFFQPSSKIELAEKMRKISQGKLEFSATHQEFVPPPYACNWTTLFALTVKATPTTIT